MSNDYENGSSNTKFCDTKNTVTKVTIVFLRHRPWFFLQMKNVVILNRYISTPVFVLITYKLITHCCKVHMAPCWTLYTYYQLFIFCVCKTLALSEHYSPENTPLRRTLVGNYGNSNTKTHAPYIKFKDITKKYVSRMCITSLWVFFKNWLI